MLAAAWQQPEFKARLESNPQAAIKEQFPRFSFESVLRIPEKPEDLSKEQLPELIEGIHLMPAALAACTICC